MGRLVPNVVSVELPGERSKVIGGPGQEAVEDELDVVVVRRGNPLLEIGDVEVLDGGTNDKGVGDGL